MSAELSPQRQQLVDQLEAERYGRPVRGVKPKPRTAEPWWPEHDSELELARRRKELEAAVLATERRRPADHDGVATG